MDIVRQYVERQRAYVPTYAVERPLDERLAGTPVKPTRSDEFGFGTPVLRPRVPVNEPRATTSRANAPESAPSEPPLNKPQAKRKKASTPVGADSERAARLAGRRERKRNKRAIVSPPQKHDDGMPGAASKGKSSAQKAKKPAALALLYGLSATNVTKNRLTLKPAPCLGVFSKGKASTKKKVTATSKPSSKNDIFSESVFLNKPSERAADHSKVDDESDDSSVSSMPNDRAPQGARATKHTKDLGNHTKPVASKTPQASTRATAESEVWDIEWQSKLPSSVRSVSSEPGANDSAPVVVDLRGAEWRASLNVAKERDNNAESRSLSVTRSKSRADRSPPLATSDLRGELGDDTPSVHPSHSASQVGRRVVDCRPPDPRVVTSKYFESKQFAVQFPLALRSNDSINVLDSLVPDVQDPTVGIRTIPRASSPTNSLVGVTQPMAGFQTQCDLAPLEFPSDCAPNDDCYVHADGAFQPHGYCKSSVTEMRDDRSIGAQPYYHRHGHFEPSVVEAQGVEYRHPQGTGRDSCWFQCCASPCLASDDVAHDVLPGYDPPVPDYEYNPEKLEYNPGEEQPCDPCFCTGAIREDSDMYEDDGSSNWDDEQAEDVAEFLEGRALLLGVPEPDRSRRIKLSGLAQAEMDVANRLQGHWRPQRLL